MTPQPHTREPESAAEATANNNGSCVRLMFSKPTVTIEFDSDADMYAFLLEHQDQRCSNVLDDNTYRITHTERGRDVGI